MAKAQAKAERPLPPLKKNFWANDRKVGYALGVLAFLLYAKTIGFGYALDDVAVLSGNRYVKDGFDGFGEILSTFYWHGHDSFAASNSGLFRPLSLLLFATEWQLFGDKPQVFHFIHILLYACVAIHLYRWLSEMLGKEGRRIALFATLLWIVLPVHTEVVANLKSADEILALLFSILGLRLLLKWSASGSIVMLLVAAVFFFLALLSKEAAVLILPLALLMLMMFRRKSIRELLAPGAILLGFALVWLAWHYAVIANADSQPLDYDYRHNALLSNPSAIDRLGTAIGLQARYWVKMLVGYPLSYNYSFNEIPVNGFADSWPWLALAGTGAALYFAWKKFRTLPALSFAIIFYFVTMLLTSNIFFPIGDIFAERFTFIPSIGFCILLAMLILRNAKTDFTPTSTAIGILVVLCVVYSARTFARTSDWKDEETLFLADVEHAPNSARVHGNAGVLYLNAALGDTNQVTRRQKFELAFQEYSAAYEIDNRDYGAAAALGQIMYHKADYKASVMWSQRSISARRQLLKEQGLPLTDDWNTLQNTGDAYVRLEQYDSARFYFNASANVFPRTDIYDRMGNAHLRSKDTVAALAAYAEAVRFDSAYIAGWDKIANLKGMRRDYAGSNEAFLKIAAIDSTNPAPWRMLYTNYGLMGDTVNAGLAAKEYYKRGGK
jgi:tetratricopeptide (TPR) repeat protein